MKYMRLLKKIGMKMRIDTNLFFLLFLSWLKLPMNLPNWRDFWLGWLLRAGNITTTLCWLLFRVKAIGSGNLLWEIRLWRTGIIYRGGWNRCISILFWADLMRRGRSRLPNGSTMILTKRARKTKMSSHHSLNNWRRRNQRRHYI